MRDNADYLELLNLGTRLRSLRLRIGMTQTELATALGFAHPSSISNIERGRRPISKEEFDQIIHSLKRKKSACGSG